MRKISGHAPRQSAIHEAGTALQVAEVAEKLFQVTKLILALILLELQLSSLLLRCRPSEASAQTSGAPSSGCNLMRKN